MTGSSETKLNISTYISSLKAELCKAFIKAHLTSVRITAVTKVSGSDSDHVQAPQSVPWLCYLPSGWRASCLYMNFSTAKDEAD